MGILAYFRVHLPTRFKENSNSDIKNEMCRIKKLPRNSASCVMSFELLTLPGSLERVSPADECAGGGGVSACACCIISFCC